MSQGSIVSTTSLSYADKLALCKCEECPLNSIKRPVFGEGTSKDGLVFVGEAPGKNEWIEGRPFVGQTGKLLDATLEAVGVKREEVFLTNVVACRPSTEAYGDLPPPALAVKACRPRLVAELEEQKAKLIVTLGSVASNAILKTKDKISDLVGATLYSEEFKALVSPTYHPAVILHGSYDLFDDIIGVFRRASMIANGKLLPPSNKLEIDYVVIDTPEKARVALEAMLAEKKLEFAIDVETDSTRFLEHELLLVTMSGINFNYVFTPQALGSEPANMLFVQMLEEPSITWYLHNMTFDFQFLRYHYGAVPVNAVDTMCMALGTTEKANQIGLKRLARTLGAPYYEEEIQKYINKADPHYSEIPRDLLIKYAASDTYYTIRLPAALQPIINEEGTNDLINNILIPAQRLFAEISTTGVLIDVEWAKHLENIWRPELEAAKEKLADYAESKGFDAHNIVKAPKTGSRLNPQSSKQLIHFFYDILGYDIPETVRSKSKHSIAKPTTSADFIIENFNDEAVQHLRTIRQYAKMLNTYVYGILDDIWVDGRVHPEFLIGATVTGRLAVKKPPLQTIPHWSVSKSGLHGIEGLATQVRGLFIATEGYVFVEADYSGLELRTLWHLSKDAALGRAIMSGDFHTLTAAAILGKPLSEVTKQDRYISKAVSFGVLYGRGAESLARGELNCTVAEAQEFINRFWSAYPDCYKWFIKVREFVAKYGYVKSPLGRKRRWSLITRDNLIEVQNQAVNAPSQSFASDICLTSAIEVQRELTTRGLGRVLFLVHDSIVMEIKKGYQNEAYRLIEQIMTTPPIPSVATFAVEIAAGSKWGNVKVVEPDQYRINPNAIVRVPNTAIYY